MRSPIRLSRRRGLLVGWPAAGALVAAWILPLLAFVYLTRQNMQLVGLVQERKTQIDLQKTDIDQLRERLRILEAVEDLQTTLTPDEAAHLAANVYEQGKSRGIDPLLLLAMIRVESEFSVRSVSAAGACGLMQLKPSTGRAIATQLGWEWPGDEHLFEPGFNVSLATTYFSDLLSRSGDVDFALAAYSCGETAVRTRLAWGMPLPQEYAGHVMAIYHQLQRRHGSVSGTGFLP
ncbi:MAG: lytic transglycosylase domain-containing protein [candidate division Zixibacteria bacterium]|nr:lytic transglycosylase domain-containing protein [candidate division Zixibacteria bacterium]